MRKLARFELRRGQQERHRARVILDTEEMVPPLYEVSCEITGGLANYLHRDVMPGIWMSDSTLIGLEQCVPRHPGNFASVVHVVEWLVEGVEIPDTGIAVILA